MAIPGEDEYNLLRRFQYMKRRGEFGWETFEDFLEWAKETGYFKYAYLRRKDLSKPFEPGNCYWSTVAEPVSNTGIQRPHKISVISQFCEGCQKRDPETCDGCLDWGQWFIENWNKNIHREKLNAEVNDGEG